MVPTSQVIAKVITKRSCGRGRLEKDYRFEEEISLRLHIGCGMILNLLLVIDGV